MTSIVRGNSEAGERINTESAEEAVSESSTLGE
jgi:hypothetical protein